MSKIILHSDQSIDKTGSLDTKLICSLTGKRSPRIGYIPSCPDPRRKYFHEKKRYYEKIGFSGLTYFDPEEDYSEKDRLLFFQSDVIHLAGGEVCSFMTRLRRTGCDEHLLAFTARGGVLLGVSAGAMLLGRTFNAVHLFGERGATQGLGLFEFEIVPHVSEYFPNLTMLREFAKKNRKTLFALNDGDVIVVSSAKIKTYGSPEQLEPA